MKKSKKIDILQKIKQALEYTNQDISYDSVSNVGLMKKISPDTPIALMKSTHTPDQFLVFNNNTDQINSVCISFAKIACISAHFNSLDNEQLDQIIDIVEKGTTIASQTKEEKIRIVEKFSMEQEYRGLEHGFGELNSSSTMIAKYFLKNIECFADIKFIFPDTFDNRCGHRISICASGDLYKNFQKAAYAIYAASEPLGVNVLESLLLIDDSQDNDNRYEVNSIGHELLHTLGLEHPEYKSLSEQLKFRSLVADDEAGGFLYEKCIKSVEKYPIGLKKWHKFLECLDTPVELQPLDVKGLITIWGESHNGSPYCHALRDEFINTHEAVLLHENANEVYANLHNDEL